MALAILLFVFFIIVMMIAFFIFPPTRFLEWFYGNPGIKTVDKEEIDAKTPGKRG